LAKMGEAHIKDKKKGKTFRMQKTRERVDDFKIGVRSVRNKEGKGRTPEILTPTLEEEREKVPAWTTVVTPANKFCLDHALDAQDQVRIWQGGD